MSLAGASISTSLLKTDAAYLQRLMDFIDDKHAFWGASHQEVPAHVLESVAQVRELATDTRSLCDSEECAEVP